MSYVLFDDEFHSHEKVVALFDGPCPGDAIGLYALALSWCGGKLTDGFVSAGFVARSGLNHQAASELVRVRLWHPADHPCEDCRAEHASRKAQKPEGAGYVVHGYLERNPTKAEVMAKREATAQRKADWRAKRDEQLASQQDNRPIHDVSHSGTERVTGTEVTASVTTGQTPHPTPHSPRPTSHLPNPTAQDPCSEGGAVAPPRRARAKPAVPLDPMGQQIATAAIWDAYRERYFARYGVEPVSNAKVRGQILQFSKRVPVDEAPDIARSYVSSNNARYVASGHSIGCLLQDAEKLRTEAITGRQGTAYDARAQDKRDGRGQRINALIQRIDAEDKAKQGVLDATAE